MCFDFNFEFLRVVGGGSDCGSIVDPVGCVAGDLGCDVTIDHVAFDIVSCEAGGFTRDLTRNVVAFEIARRRLGDTAGDVAFDTPCRSTDNCACDVAFDIVLDTALSDFFLPANGEYKCHCWVRLRMRIVKAALSFFPDILTSKVSDFLEK